MPIVAMKTQVKKPAESNKFNQLLAPYCVVIRVGNAIISIERGSISAINRMMLFDTNLLSTPTLLAKIGQYCEFNSTSSLILGGEHLVSNSLVNTFSESFHLRHHIADKTMIAPASKGPITIGNNVVLSASAIVLSGSNIGDNVLVAAGALVNGDFSSNQVIGGVPAKAIRSINAPEIAWWDLAEECIPEYIQTKNVMDPKPNKSKNLRLVFEGQQNKEGKIGKLDLSGLIIKENFIPLSEMSQHHLAYFSDSNKDDDYMTISDEVFNDLL
jgi:acetyltransferase-like isoleucine patch superfamily enzyme